MNYQIFRNILKNSLHKKKITTHSLSIQADIPTDTLHSILYGKTKDIKLSTLIKIADVLECDLDSLIGRNPRTKEQQLLMDRICCLPAHSINKIKFLLELEEHCILQKSTNGTDYIQIFCPTGNMKDGMLYDSTRFDLLDITDYPTFLKHNVDLGIKILSRNYEPVYYPNDIILLSHMQAPQYNDIVLYIDNDGLLFIRQFTEQQLIPINGFGKAIPTKDIFQYTALGVVLKVVKDK